MNQGAEIVLARMDSNPDEFVSSEGRFPQKWAWALDHIMERGYLLNTGKEMNAPTTTPYHYHNIPPFPFLTNEEVLALYRKLTSLQGKVFTDQVMKTLLNPENREENTQYDAATSKPKAYYAVESNTWYPYPVDTKGLRIYQK